MTLETVDVRGQYPTHSSETRERPIPVARWSAQFVMFKRGCDYCFSIGALPIVVLCALVLLVINPFVNPGPLFFRQERMGLRGRRFSMWKFRTMLPAATNVRAHDAPLEEDRITKLGRVMRKSRIDELPNIINVLSGEMSLVGPRPDAYSHASEYIRSVPNYHYRLRVRPGITGLAQVRGGYADTPEAILRKARLDRFYVERSCGRMDLYIIWRTIYVMLTGFGAR